MHKLAEIRRWRRLVALTAVAALIAVACGGDEGVQGGDAPEQTPTAAAIDLAAFCDAAIQAEALFQAGPELDEQGNPTEEGVQQFSEQLQSLLDDLEQNAPEEVSSEVDSIVQDVRQSLDQEDRSATQTREFFQADAAVDDYVFENCELGSTQEITAVNYAFEDVPATLSAGQVGIRLDNQGTEVHEAVIFRINDDVEMSIEELLELPEEEAEAMAEFRAVAFAGPGSTGSAVVDLKAGRYALVCFIPVGTTSMEALFAGPEGAEGESPTAGESPAEAATEGGPGEEGPPHFTRGMFTEFEVS